MQTAIRKTVGRKQQTWNDNLAENQGKNVCGGKQGESSIRPRHATATQQTLTGIACAHSLLRGV